VDEELQSAVSSWDLSSRAGGEAAALSSQRHRRHPEDQLVE